jgi:hypothetical protein
VAPAKIVLNAAAPGKNAMYEPVVTAGKPVKLSATGPLPVPGTAVQQWMCPKGLLLARPANDSNTVMELKALSKVTIAAPVAVEVGTGSPVPVIVVVKTVTTALAGMAALKVTAAAAQISFSFMEPPFGLGTSPDAQTIPTSI